MNMFRAEFKASFSVFTLVFTATFFTLSKFQQCILQNYILQTGTLRFSPGLVLTQS